MNYIIGTSEANVKVYDMEDNQVCTIHFNDLSFISATKIKQKEVEDAVVGCIIDMVKKMFNYTIRKQDVYAGFAYQVALR